MGEVNFWGGQGPTGPNSEVPKAQIIPPQGEPKNSVGSDIWSGTSPKPEAPIPVNENIEVGSLDEKAGALTAARTAVMNGAALAFAETPTDIYKCKYVPGGGGIFQIVDGDKVVGYAKEAVGPTDAPDIKYN